MSKITEIFSKLKTSSGLILVLIFATFYFGYYAVKGNRGYVTYRYLNKEVAEARKNFEKYEAEKKDLENKVKLLSSGSIDPDMLDERARIVLNVVGNNEFVIFDDEDLN